MYIGFLSFPFFLISISHLSFLLIIPGSENALKKINIDVITKRIIINIIKKLLIFSTKNYTIELNIIIYILNYLAVET